VLRNRLIPCLQLNKGSLVKTVRFGRFGYIGDPANTCRIFNEFEVDELAIVDIRASVEGREPSFDTLRDIVDECFMPVSYGGGIRSVGTAEKVLALGVEKVIVGTAAHARPSLLSDIASAFGTQCVIAAIDVKSDWLGRQRCRARSGRSGTGRDPVDWARTAMDHGAGEILLTNIDREGTWQGLDLDLVKRVSESVSIPVIAHGGAGSHAGVAAAVKHGGASAVALGNMVVYQKRDMGVLVNFPSAAEQRAMGL
jgi:cyclase